MHGDADITGPDSWKSHYARSGLQLLTPAETQVLAQILSGQSNKEAALRLKVSPRTVELHRARIYSKLGVHSALELFQTLFDCSPSSDLVQRFSGAPPARKAFLRVAPQSNRSPATEVAG
jgi:DNA-binding CsgD family transcriptional regulator